LEPSVGAALSNYIQYGSPNKASLPMINVEDLNNPAIYPSDEIRQRLFFLVNVNLVAVEMYDQLWEQILIEHGS
jgi:spermidine/putrescine-binding protein